MDATNDFISELANSDNISLASLSLKSSNYLFNQGGSFTNMLNKKSHCSLDSIINQTDVKTNFFKSKEIG